MIFLFNIVEVLPIIAYLWRNQKQKPHDCFTCWNKDPERKYSVYQYSKTDWNQIMFLRRPLNDRAREARALTKYIEDHNPENVPSEANTALVQQRVNSSKKKSDVLAEEMA